MLIVIIIPSVYKLHILNIYIFCIYSDEEMTKIPETIDAGTDGADGDPTLRLLALLHFLTMVVLIVIPLVVFFILF